ncbi:hypothetical protein M433DRAFT_275693 [Acidomyces richmondensis BFW]|nr:MAG: hypothetical protein FE78DRAFT_449702 [Acidomyces sp. 'richmondensis']KYG49635.1 hypothetical protein M433DRAFT_275693 [Acidomyces richmondensis BFW]
MHNHSGQDFTLNILFSCSTGEVGQGNDKAIFHPGDTVSGFLKITSRANIVLENVIITLEGMVRIWECSPALENELLAVQHRFLKQVQPLPYCDGRVLEITARNSQMIPFRFKLPQHVLFLDSHSEQLLRLPPSLEMGEILTDNSGSQCMQPLVEYGVRTLVTVHISNNLNKVQVQQFRKFALIPITEPTPPIEQADFPGEFKPVSTTVLRKHPLAAPIGELCIAMDEPEPLRVLGDANHNCSKAWVKLLFKPSKAMESRAYQEQWRCTLNSQIRVKTFYSTMPLNEMASNGLLRANRHLRFRSELVSLESRKTDLYLRTFSTEFYEGNQNPYNVAYSSKLLLPIVVADSLLPTFGSLLVARRYALIVSLRIEGLSHQPLLVEVPLQVCYVNSAGSQIPQISSENANMLFHTTCIKPNRASGFGEEETNDILPGYGV